jgi:hypothetical protein
MSEEKTAPPASPPPATDAIGKALDALPLDTLQAEREKMAGDLRRPDLSAHDAAIARKGGSPPDKERADTFRDHLMAEKSTAQDYTPELGRFADIEGVANGIKNLVASLNFSRDAGNSVASRLAHVIAQLDDMPREQWQDWVAQNDRMTMRIVGNQEGYDALVKQAKAALARSGTEVAKKISEHVLLKDAILLRLLGNSQQAWERLQSRPGKK